MSRRTSLALTVAGFALLFYAMHLCDESPQERQIMATAGQIREGRVALLEKRGERFVPVGPRNGWGRR